MKTIETNGTYGRVKVDLELDDDRELNVDFGDRSTWLTEAGVRELRDHLSAVLGGDGPKPPVPPTLTGMLTFTLTGGA